MANAYTDTSGSSLGNNLVKAAYDRLVEFALRSQPQWRAAVDKRPVQQTMPGSSVIFNLYADMATATGALTETTDPDSVAVPSTSTVTVTLNEYGNVALVTRKLRLLSLSDVDPGIADVIAFNMLDSVDTIVRDVARAGTNVWREVNGGFAYNSGATNTVRSTDLLIGRTVRGTVAKLRNNKSIPRVDGNYLCYVHPDQSVDLRQQTSNAAWRTPHEYQAAGNIWDGTIGIFENAQFIETPRIFTAVDGFNPGVTAATVYRSVMMGKQAVAEAVAEEFGVHIGPVTDKLSRFRPIGWYGVAGWARYREESLVRIETSSTLSAQMA